VPVGEVSTIPAQTPKIVYLIGVEGTAPRHTLNPLKSSLMYQLQILFGKQGNWENTVFLPMEKMRALDIMAMHNKLWSNDHCYRIIPVS